VAVVAVREQRLVQLVPEVAAKVVVQEQTQDRQEPLIPAAAAAAEVLILAS
jgi:hypothetical protein